MVLHDRVPDQVVSVKPENEIEEERLLLALERLVKKGKIIVFNGRVVRVSGHAPEYAASQAT
jgi:hypothetical protein